MLFLSTSVKSSVTLVQCQKPVFSGFAEFTRMGKNHSLFVKLVNCELESFSIWLCSLLFVFLTVPCNNSQTSVPTLLSDLDAFQTHNRDVKGKTLSVEGQWYCPSTDKDINVLCLIHCVWSDADLRSPKVPLYLRSVWTQLFRNEPCSETL